MSREIHVRFCERLEGRFLRATRRNIHVSSERAGQRIMAGVTTFLWERLKLTVNAAKSAVARPWTHKFLGYSVTEHKETRLRIAPESLARLRARVTNLCLKGRGQRLERTIEQLRPVLRGWMNYFQQTQGRRALEEMDAWVRRRMRVIAWRHWRRPATRASRLSALGLDAHRAWKSSVNGRGRGGMPGQNTWWPQCRRSTLPTWGWSHWWTPTSDSSVLLEPPDADPHVRWCERRGQ